MSHCSKVKLSDRDLAMAVLTGLEHRYLRMEGDTTGTYADILPDKETGLYTLCPLPGVQKTNERAAWLPTPPGQMLA